MPADWMVCSVKASLRHRHVLQRFVALARRNDDLLQLVGLRREYRFGGHHGSRQLAITSGMRRVIGVFIRPPYHRLLRLSSRAGAVGLLAFEL